ncbi:MAG: DUF4115 domain-containing protein [Emcibacter sp.]|nr:DUF4115 domain-containing protein [Emcibacter sp.]
MVDILSVDQEILSKNNVDYRLLSTKSDQRDLTVGQKLSITRQNRRGNFSKNTLDEISDELCIRPHLLAALEQDNFADFPSACYAAGFLKNYAAYLDLNVEDIVSQYKKEFAGSTKKVELVFLEGEKRHSHFYQIIISLAMLSLLIAYGVWYNMGGNKNIILSSLPDVSAVTSNIMISALSGDEIPVLEKNIPEESIPEKSIPEESHKVQMSLETQQSTVNVPVKAQALLGQVHLKVTGDTWLRIKNADNEILADRVFRAGEEFYSEDGGDMNLMISNAGAVSVFVGDVALSSLGELGEIRQDVSLSKQDLLTKIAQTDLQISH